MGQHRGEITCFSAGMGSGQGGGGRGAALGELGCWPVRLPGPAGSRDGIQGQREATRYAHRLTWKFPLEEIG